MDTCQNVLALLKVPIAEDKTEGPTTVIVFLGLELDSDEMVVRIPKEKISEIVDKIKHVLSKDKVTLRVMQSLIGSLNFACRAVVPGRPFCRRLINAICGLTKQHHHLRVSKGVKLDLEMWLRFFDSFNGVSVFHDRFWVSNDDVQLHTDSAAGLGLGFGIYFKGKWLAVPWPSAWHDRGLTNDITLLELFPIVVAAQLWGQSLRDKKIRFNCDNMAVVHILNTMTSKSDKVMILIRYLTMLSIEFNMVIRATHVSGVTNSVCDALSRFQLTRFRELVPEAEAEPCQMPCHLWQLLE